MKPCLGLEIEGVRILADRYHNMKARLGPKFYKHGKRAGQLRVPGIELPFTLDEFRTWAKVQLFNGTFDRTVPCSYCNRPLNIKTIRFDHLVPVSRGGSAGLDNLAPSCSDCNAEKGILLPEEYRALDAWLFNNLSPQSYQNVKRKLRTGDAFMRMRFFVKKEPALQAEAAL